MVREDESNPFHPFKDFNRKLEISTSHLPSFLPTVTSPFSYYTDEVRTRLCRLIQSRGMSAISGNPSASSNTSSSPSAHSIPRARPMDYNPTLEDWQSEDESLEITALPITDKLFWKTLIVKGSQV